MNHIQKATPETPDDLHVVEFYPSADDYIHVATHVSETVASPGWIKFAYQAFLFLNAIGFPAFLWFSEYVVAGIVVLAVNLVLLSWLIPWFNRLYLRQYYDYVYGPREKEVARVELTAEGIRYSSNDGEAYWPWNRIDLIEESDESIYFFFLGNGIAVRKSGFAYKDQEIAFIQFARHQLQSLKPKTLDR